MSYLVLPAGIPDFSKAVMSLWFRVPQESIDKTVASRPDSTFPDDPRNVLLGILPLLTIGTPPTSPRYEGNYVDVVRSPGDTTYPLPIYDSPRFGKVADDPISPSFIGLDCYSSGEKNVATLTFNLQMLGRASIQAVAYNRTLVEAWSFFDPDSPPNSEGTALLGTPGTGWTFIFGWYFFTQMVDNSHAWNTQPEHFLVQSTVQLKPEQWHHVLLSFDISDPCITHGQPPDLNYGTGTSNASIAAGTDSYCRLWYAVDDVNYNSLTYDMGPYEVTGSTDPNAILTENAYRVAQTQTFLPYNCTPGTPHYNFDTQPIPSSTEFGVPASSGCVDHICRVELAELQIFTGVTLDTGIVANRRAFVDADGKPVNPDRAEQMLGKRPDILLHGSAKWKEGRNTGSLGIDGSGNVLSAGQLQRQGVINAYTPEPSLHGAQVRAGPVQLTREGASV